METAEYLVLAIFVLSGCVSLAAAIFNFDWFFQSRKAATFVHWLGRNGARLFYGLLGIALISAGILFFFFGYR
ncbi:MAG: immunity 17 family protein [Tannerellaceae bacterium]|nr:immunity 17 family protein [Tannerellaceae bacterium]